MNGLEQHTNLIAENTVDYDSLLPIYYNFEHSNIPFECQILHHDDGSSYVINLNAKIGFLPYSSENHEKRERILKNFGNLMSHNLITMDHHCNMSFPLKTLITGEITAKKVMETILYTLLDVQEILDIIEKTMYTPSIAHQHSR